MLSSIEIDKIMRNDPFTSRIYAGTVALDELPVMNNTSNGPLLYIVNTDPAHLPGTHWFAVYISSTTAAAAAAAPESKTSLNEHFDSAGQQPIERINNILLLNGPNYMYNSQRVQSYSSETCGYFCIMYAYYRARGVSFPSFLAMFTENLIQNEATVRYFFKMNF